MHLDRREFHLRERRDKRRIARAERRRVEDRSVYAGVVGGIDLVDHLALDIRVEDFDFQPEFGGKAADALVIFGKLHWPENLELDLAAHVHTGAMDHENLGHLSSAPWVGGGREARC